MRHPRSPRTPRPACRSGPRSPGVTMSSSRSSNSSRCRTRANGSETSTESGPNWYRPRVCGKTVYVTRCVPWAGIPETTMPGGSAERGRQPILEQQERRGGGRAVLDVDLHRDSGPGRNPDVGERSVDRDPLLSPPDEERRDRRQRGQAERDDLEAGGADDPRGQPHGESGEQDGHPAAGRHQGFSATGTGTSARISSRMTCGDRPLMTASAVTMIRWASTGMASAFTSSGIT